MHVIILNIFIERKWKGVLFFNFFRKYFAPVTTKYNINKKTQDLIRKLEISNFNNPMTHKICITQAARKKRKQ